AIKLIPPQDQTAHENASVPVYVPTGIFTPNHPDFGKPNLLQAEMSLQQIELHLKRINGILTAVVTLMPNVSDEVNALLWAAYKLNEDKTMLGSLRSALCLDRKETKQ
ncbi:hypothetical protein, partial [Bordetella hinzii]